MKVKKCKRFLAMLIVCLMFVGSFSNIVFAEGSEDIGIETVNDEISDVQQESEAPAEDDSIQDEENSAEAENYDTEVSGDPETINQSDLSVSEKTVTLLTGTTLDPGVSSDATGKVVQDGDTGAFTNGMPFATWAINRDKLKLTPSVAKLYSSDVSVVKNDFVNITGDYCMVLNKILTPGASYSLTGDFAVLKYENAATDTKGNTKDVTITLSDLTVQNISDTAAATSQLNRTAAKEVIAIGYTTLCSQFFDASNDQFKSSTGRTKMTVKVTIDGAAEGTFSFGARDIDVKDQDTYGGFNGDYSEREVIKSGAATKAYITKGTYLNISNTGNDTSTTANGLTIKATQTDEDTFLSGYLINANATGLQFEWRGNICGTALSTPSNSIAIRPHYKGYGDTSYKMGSTGGTISMSDSASSSIEWSSDAADSAGYVKRYYAIKKETTITPKPANGYALKVITENGAQNENDAAGKTHYSTTTLTPESKDVYPDVYLDAFYVPASGTVKITKVDNDDVTKKLPGATFTLSGTSDYFGDVSITSTDNGDGTYTFNDVPLGEKKGYTITETVPPAGYILSTATKTVKIKSNGMVVEMDFRDDLIKSAVELTKTVDNTKACVGDELTYTIALKNTGNVDLKTYTVKDVMPEQLTYVSDTAGGTYDAATNTLTWDSGALAIGASFEVRVTAKVEKYADNLINTASASPSDPTDPTPEDASVTVPVKQVELTKTADKTAACVGDELAYTVTLKNTGNADLAGYTVKDAMPGGLTYVSDTKGGTYDAASNSVTWDSGVLPVGESFEVQVTAKVEKYADNLVNTASASSSDPTDPTPEDASVSVPVKQVELTKAVDKTKVKVNGEVVYTITLKNTGNVDLDSYTVKDVMPAELEYVSCTQDGTYDDSANAVTWESGKLAIGASFEVQVTAKVLEAKASIVNTASAESRDPSDPAPDSATVSVKATATASGNTTNSTSVNTGDTQHPEIYMVLMLVSIAALTAVTLRRFKHRRSSR